MEAKDTVMNKAEMREALIKAGCPEELIYGMGKDIQLWWKAGWIQEILLAQKKIGAKLKDKEIETEMLLFAVKGELMEFLVKTNDVSHKIKLQNHIRQINELLKEGKDGLPIN